MKNNLLKWAMIIIAVLVLLSMLVSLFTPLANPIATALGKPVEVVKSAAQTIAGVGLSSLVCIAGVLVIAGAPVLGVILIVVGGLALLSSVGVFSSLTE